MERQTRVTNAIILAGGKGERLRPYTESIPKPMVEVDGRPLLYYKLEKLESIGVEQVILAAGYKHEVLEENLLKAVGRGKRFGMKIQIVVEEFPLGTGGAIKAAASRLGKYDYVWAGNGDILSEINLRDFEKRHWQNVQEGASGTMAYLPHRSGYGMVRINKTDNLITEVLGEKEIIPDVWVNAGIYIYSKEAIDRFPDKGDHESLTIGTRENPNPLGIRPYVYDDEDGFWVAVDTHKDLRAANEHAAKLPRAKRRAHILG